MWLEEKSISQRDSPSLAFAEREFSSIKTHARYLFSETTTERSFDVSRSRAIYSFCELAESGDNGG